jgi:preprotein translocase subunit SecF
MNITAHRRLWFSISGSFALASLVIIFWNGLNLGLDFTGGVRMAVEISQEKEVNLQDINNFFQEKKAAGFLTKNANVQPINNNGFLLTFEELSDEKTNEIKTEFLEKFSATEKQFQRVDSSVGASFKRKSIWAIGMVLVGIVLFVAWAFRRVPKAINPWRFGGVAILALAHDILILLGVFALLGAFVDIELGLTFITALLATLGFSVNDTIVTLDRLRENIRTQKAHETFEDVVEKSIQQTLRRSLFTSVSTLLPLVSLFIWGAESITWFVLALIVGIIVGTYSSIFVASPVLITWKKIADK